MLITYLTFSGLTFSVTLSAFLKDRLESKKDPTAWTFIIVAAAIWPVTLLCIINRKLRTDQLQPSLMPAVPQIQEG